jgi:hypothetical protein
MMALSYNGPPTWIVPTMVVIIPSGAIARTILSAQPIDWLINYVVTLSLNRASRLDATRLKVSISLYRLQWIDYSVYRARLENKLLEKSSLASTPMYLIKQRLTRSRCKLVGSIVIEGPEEGIEVLRSRRLLLHSLRS